MQFKYQGGKVQVLLYTGFDEAKNAPIVRSVGSFDKYTYKPSPGLLDKLSLEQRDELDAECNEIWDAMAELVRAMREAGYPRPTRDRKPGADAGQGSLFD